LAGGILAHNDEHRIERSVRSLLGQQLPDSVTWGRLWIVASGCTDRTIEIARALAAVDSRVQVVVEPERRGKAAAIGEVLRRAEGESLVLLNSDAVAEPGAVAELLAKADGKPRPFAVMARPTVPSGLEGDWAGTLRWMWDLHHELHLEMLADGTGSHLSDEMLLVSLPATRWIEDGIINDGSYCAVWLRNHSGGCWYAPDARVTIDIPRTPADHLRQRRRIHVGNAQVGARLGRPPTTAGRFLLENPRRALAALRRALARPRGLRHFARTSGYELVSHFLAAWDRVPPRRNHVLWSRIASPRNDEGERRGEAPRAPVGDLEVDRRVRVLFEVSRMFGTSVDAAQLSDLLPERGRTPSEELAGLLRRHPELTPPTSAGEVGLGDTADHDRAARGKRYRLAAEEILAGPLGWLRPSLRCIGLTGSTAYGRPAEGDDLDFFVVTRSGALSWFLAGTYLSLRLDRLRGAGSSRPTPCFNYVVDDRRASGEFANGRGLLFAREALTAQILEGDTYYRGLLAAAPWLGLEIPRLFAARACRGVDVGPSSAGLGIRILSGLSFVPLAAYLQLAGLRRNAHARAEGRPQATFRTLTSPVRIAFQSRRFEDLRATYEGAVVASSGYPASASSPRVSTLR
jgi:glycosyltransferase involved in cell wall biosynthesis